MEEILFIPITLIMLFVAGIFSVFFMLFSQIFVLIQCGLFLLRKVVPKKFKTFYQWVVYMSPVLLWLSVFISRHRLTESANFKKCFVAGFPFEVFVFPCGAMGGDYVPGSMWTPFYLSYLLWIAVSVLMVLAISKTKMFKSKKAMKILLAVYIAVNFYGLGMLLLAFD